MFVLVYFSIPVFNTSKTTQVIRQWSKTANSSHLQDYGLTCNKFSGTLSQISMYEEMGARDEFSDGELNI